MTVCQDKYAPNEAVRVYLDKCCISELFAWCYGMHDCLKEDKPVNSMLLFIYYNLNVRLN